MLTSEREKIEQRLKSQAGKAKSGAIFSIDTDMEDVFCDIRSEFAEMFEGASRSRYSKGAGGVWVAVSYAVNDTLKHMKSYASKLIRAQYYVKKKDLDQYIGHSKAFIHKSGQAIIGTLRVGGRKNLPLIEFDAQQKKNFVSVRVLKANRRRAIKPGVNSNIEDMSPGGGRSPILATKEKGRAAVWIKKGNIYARTVDKPFPIILYGPSLMAFFSHKENRDLLQDEQASYLVKRLNHHFGQLAKGRLKAGYQAAGKGTGGAYR